jgi:aminoglycoside phosphotransferase
MDQTVPADRRRDPAAVGRLATCAAQILARHGGDFARARRAGGYSNLTWLADGLAVRIAAEAGPGDLLREAKLAALLPPEVGYPRLIASGVLEGHEWLLAEEAPGMNLGAAWPALDWEARVRALNDLWAKTEAVHRVSLVEAAPYVRPQSPFYAANPPAAAEQIRQLEEREMLQPAQSTVLMSILDRFWHALSEAKVVLNHGDLCTENALWHEGRVSALVDFEFAVAAPVELDANELLGQAYIPPEAEDPLPDPTGAGLRRLREAATNAVLPALGQPGAKDRLLGYAVLLKLWAVHKWLADGDDRAGFPTWQPHRELTELAAGNGGYLAPVLKLLG